MADVFNNKDFLEQCKVGNFTYSCICSSLPQGVVYTDYGQQSMANFTIEIKTPLIEEVRKNTKVIFRGQQYKVQQLEYDSANTSVKLYLVGMSKGI